MCALDIEKIATIRPSARQLAWQQMEFYGFIHFSLNTFTGQEWGDGQEDPNLFNPVDLDARQWAEVCKSAGMSGLILTCKHHGGFCLWPSKFTDYSVRRTPWKNGRGDLVRECADACRETGLKFGIYLSPWDRHEACYGDSPRYNQYFLNQLTELLTGYGDLFAVWFDGACGEGPNGKRQVYDWDAYYALIRQLQPEAVIAVCGPDVRWCGNEAGACRTSEWSVVPASLRDQEKIASESQQSDDSSFRVRLRTDAADLGSRPVIENAGPLVWYPAEVDTSIRPGWFYHPEEDDRVRPLAELVEIYEQAVGGNACLLLNVPPDPRGLIHPNDLRRLAELGQIIRDRQADDLAVYAAGPDRSGGWRLPAGQETGEWTLRWPGPVRFNRVVLQEIIAEGQRIESFDLLIGDGENRTLVFSGTTVGYQKFCRFPLVETDSLTLRITASRWSPVVGSIRVYQTEPLPLV